MKPEDAQSTACPYCGLHDHTGREHMQFVMSLSLGETADESDPEPTAGG